jgi:hypothetical protein
LKFGGGALYGPRTLSKTILFASVVVAALVGCGPSNRDGNGGGGGNGDGGGGGGGGGTLDAHDPDGSACATSQSMANQTPLDIFIMLDRSGSMGSDDHPNKWDNVTSAITSFVDQPSLAGVSVGIQYFGVPPSVTPATCPLVFGCTTDNDCGSAACGPCFNFSGTAGQGTCVGAGEQALGGDSDSCVAADYATASVEFTALPAGSNAITASMSSHSPDGAATPSEPALAGALQHARAWATSHAGDAVVVVFATDGDPTGCDATNDIPHAQTDAMNAATTSPKIPTYVIGVGADLGNLNAIAASGGTGSAFIVDANANANAQFLAAMNAIQHSALGCQYTIPQPTSGAPNYSEVNVIYTIGGSTSSETVPNVANAAACPASGDGWYYNDVAAPTQIILCGSTCTKVAADSTGEVDITLGCSTVIE